MPNVIQPGALQLKDRHPVVPTHSRGTLRGPGLIVSELSSKGLGGFLRTIARLTKVALNYKSHRALVHTISQGGTKKILSLYPRLAYRYTQTYLSTAIPWARRLDMLQGHYQFINEQFGKPFFDRALDDRLTLWSETIDDHEFAVSLTGPCLVTIHREGDLSLNFKMNGHILCKLAFSIIPSRSLQANAEIPEWLSEHVLFVGQVQGAPCAFPEIKQATKICVDVAPQDLLMSALAGLAQSLHISHVVGVATEHNISIDQLNKLGTGFDYNGFWERYAGRILKEGHRLMSVPYGEKPMHLIQAKHRGRNKLKRAFKARLQQSVADTMNRQDWRH
jgi:uncharacterized protein VirK/YbjX